MSVQLIAWALKQKTGSATRKSVLLALADRANQDTLLCCPSIARISEDTELSERAVRQALTDLVDAGLISRERQRKQDGSRGTYRYQFPTAPPAQPAAPPAATLPAPAAAEPEVVLEPEEVLAAAPTVRPRNELWDALTAVFGDATTISAQSRRGRVIKSLRAARASPEDVIARARRWPLHFDTATLTETALEKHWDTLAREPLRRSR